MPQTCTICTHSRREAIDLLIVAGEESNRRIATQFQVSEAALRRHAGAHLPDMLIAQAAEEEEERRRNLIAEVDKVAARMAKMYDACDRWLSDPDNPGEYDLCPRSDEVNVVYTEPGPDGKRAFRKAKLSELLARIERADGGRVIISGEVKTADIRDLVLKTQARLLAGIELIGKLKGQIDTRPQINILALPQWGQIRGVILDSLAPFPDARIALSDALDTYHRN